MIWINGQLCSAAAAQVSVFDRGFLYGDGLFETMPIYAGQPFLLDDHLDRLTNGARMLRIANAPSHDDWRGAISALLAAGQEDAETLRLSLSRGVNTGAGLACASAQRPTWIAACLPARRRVASLYSEGAVLAVVPQVHALPSQMPTAYKHANYLASILACDDAQAQGADEAVVCNLHGRVCEGAYSNLFFVFGDTLVTPPLEEGPLAGIVRARMLALAAELGIAHAETPIPLSHLVDANEAFITNSLVGIAPIRRIVGIVGGDHHYPAPGPVTQRLGIAYAALIEAHTGFRWPHAVQLAVEKPPANAAMDGRADGTSA